MREEGSILILVLWVLALLAAVGGLFALEARVSRTVSTQPWRELQVEAAARTILEVVAPLVASTPAPPSPGSPPRIVPDGRPYELQAGPLRLTFSITAEAAKIDLNRAPEPEVVALFRRITGSGRVARAVLDWRDRDSEPRQDGGAEADFYSRLRPAYRPPNRPFRSMAELRMVRGVTPALFWGRLYGPDGRGPYRLLDLVTVYGSKGVVEEWASPLVREVVEAEGRGAGRGGGGGRSGVFCLEFSFGGVTHRIYWERRDRGFKVLEWLQDPTGFHTRG